MKSLQNLFSWKDTIPGIPWGTILIDVTSKQQIGEFPAGTLFPRVEVDTRCFVIILYTNKLVNEVGYSNKEDEHRFRFEPLIVEKID